MLGINRAWFLDFGSATAAPCSSSIRAHGETLLRQIQSPVSLVFIQICHPYVYITALQTTVPINKL